MPLPVSQGVESQSLLSQREGTGTASSSSLQTIKVQALDIEHGTGTVQQRYNAQDKHGKKKTVHGIQLTFPAEECYSGSTIRTVCGKILLAASHSLLFVLQSCLKADNLKGLQIAFCNNQKAV